MIKTLFRSLLPALLVVVTSAAVMAQPYRMEVDRFKKTDSLRPPAAHQVLFIGSSSFTKWTDVQEYFPGTPIINRGFGGSQLPDQTRYIDEIVIPYNPRQVVIYCGENDMASADSVTAQVVLARFRELFFGIRKKLPKVPIAFISMKPSPSRMLIQEKIREGNALIQAFLKKQKRTAYIDVYKDMIDDEGKPRQELFLEDNLHMNKTGYAIWQRIIEPYLLKK